MRIKKYLLILILVIFVRPAYATFTETYPHLKDLTFNEPKSNYYLGFGVSPLGILHGRMMFGLDFFQLHWLKGMWDVEVFNVSYSFTSAQPTYLQSSSFTFRTAPKVRFFRNFSVGPLLGYEFISFPQISATLLKNNFTSPEEPFSTRGITYGLIVSETFPYKDDYLLKINEVLYRQTYSTEKTDNGWNYNYTRRELRNDKGPIEADMVAAIEISLLF